MDFQVLAAGAKPPEGAKGRAYLVTDNTDDWGKFRTQYTLIVCDSAGAAHPIGAVKIGQFSWKVDQARPDIPEEFETLEPQFFSLGQDDSYYENLKKRRTAVREAILTALRDIAADHRLYAKAIKEPVTTQSLLRLVTGATAQHQFRRLAAGGERLTSYEFSYTSPKPAGRRDEVPDPVTLDFKVVPDSNPPTNIHVLIGPNGVGKTQLLEWMAHALTKGKAEKSKHGVLEQVGADGLGYFAGLVSVTFSAFDPFDPLPDRRGDVGGLRYNYVGLKSTSKSHPPGTLKNLKLLTGDFTRSLQGCTTGVKVERWREAVKILETDPSFQDQGVSSLLDEFGEEEGTGADWDVLMDKLASDASGLFLGLSTGHKIVLLSMTRLVEAVEDRTLVLFDEPESHLHPPLLSAFIRALSDLLIKRNGVAILATHSPVILQEVPRRCVWKLRRYGSVVQAERPEVETFGENVAVLTREIFGLDIAQSGFHSMVRQAVDEKDDYDSVLNVFGEQLGGEARAVARALLAVREGED
jgi:hypothetical protein